MPLVLLILLFVPLGIGMVAPSWRVAAITSVMGAAVAWILIARFTYVSPVSLNEPEWWSGLGIVCALAGIGVTIGVVLRHRRVDPAADPLIRRRP